MTFRTRLFLMMASVTAAIEIVSMLVVNFRFQRDSELYIRHEFSIAHRRVDRFQRLSLENLVTLASNISQDPRLRGSIVTGDRQTIGRALDELYVNYWHDLFWLISPEGVVMARVENPELWGDTISTRSVVDDARNGFDSGDVWLENGKLYQVAAVPVKSGGITIAILLIGVDFQTNLTQQFTQLAGLKLAFLSPSGVISTSESGQQRQRLTSKLEEMHPQGAFSLESAPHLPTRDPGKDTTLAPIVNFEVEENPFGGAVFKLCDVAGVHLADGLIYRSLAPEHRQLRRIQIGLLVVDLVAILLTFLIAYLISKRITGPIDRLVGSSARLGAGDLESPIKSEGGDEIGALAHALEEMRLSLRRAQDDLIQSERLTTIGRMASSIIHDFRQPISVIYGYLDLLTLPNTPQAKIEGYKEKVFRQFDRMLGMINELLEFARGEARLKPGKVKLSQFIEEIVHSFEREERRQNIVVSSKIEWNGEIQIDAARLQRGIENIIRNAVQALQHDGKIEIKVASEGNFVHISIADDGPGIPQEIADRLFEPFVTFGKSEGTGLGLAVAQKVVTQHGGTISVESEPGKGATFHIRLPIG